MKDVQPVLTLGRKHKSSWTILRYKKISQVSTDSDPCKRQTVEPEDKFKSYETERLGNESWTGAGDGFPSKNVYRFKNMLLPEIKNN